MPSVRRSAVLPYPPSYMYDLVNDIKSYPEFVPFCSSTTIISQDDDEIRASLEFSKGGLSKSFTTCNRLQSGKMIEIKLIHGPFEQLEGFWRFEALDDEGCRIMLDLDYEFDNMLVAIAFGPIFEQIANQLLDAFCDRAKALFGGITA